MKRPFVFAAVVALLGTVQFANAHGVWIAERWGELGVVYGDGASDDPYDPAKIKRVEAFDEDGTSIAVTVEPAKRSAVLSSEKEPAFVVIDFDNGFYSKGADGKWVNKPKSEVPGAQTAGRCHKHAVSILHLHGKELPVLPVQDLQIVPSVNPTERKAGDQLALRILYKGEPVSGLAVISDYVNMSETKTQQTTNDLGELAVEVRNNGLDVLAVVHTIELDGNADADIVQHFATFSFVAGGEHSH